MSLTEVGECVGADVEVFGPLHHAPQDGHQTLQPLGLHGLLLSCRRPKLPRLAPSRYLAQVIYQPGGHIRFTMTKDTYS